MAPSSRTMGILPPSSSSSTWRSILSLSLFLALVPHSAEASSLDVSLTLGFTDATGHEPGSKDDGQIKLLASNSGFCFVSTVAGQYGSDQEMCRVFEAEGNWWLEYRCGNSHCGCLATCMKLDANRTYGEVTQYVNLTGKGDDTLYSGINTNEGYCAITEISGNYAGDGELCKITTCPDDDSQWCLNKTSGQDEMGCGMMCLSMPTPNWDPSNQIGSTQDYQVVTGKADSYDNPLVTYLNTSQAMLGLSQVGGKLAGSGEYCGVEPDDDGIWVMKVKSGQSTFSCASAISKIPDNGWADADGFWHLVASSQSGVVSQSVTTSVTSTDTLSHTVTWGVSATAGVSVGCRFAGMSLSHTASTSVSEEVSNSISITETQTTENTCESKDDYSVVRMYQWNMNLYHNGIGTPSTVQTDSWLCQYLTFEDDLVEPQCPLLYCNDIKCESCKPWEE